MIINTAGHLTQNNSFQRAVFRLAINDAPRVSKFAVSTHQSPEYCSVGKRDVVVAEELLKLREANIDIEHYGTDAYRRCAKEINNLLDEYAQLRQSQQSTHANVQKISPEIKNMLLSDFLPRAILSASKFSDYAEIMACAVHLRRDELIDEGKRHIDDHLEGKMPLELAQKNVSMITERLYEFEAKRKSLLVMSKTAKSWQEHFQAVRHSIAHMDATNS